MEQLLLLLALVEWGEKTARVVQRTDRETIRQDEQAELALARTVKIVGEIAGQLLRRYPDWYRDRDTTDLSDAYRMRNRLAHGYDAVSAERLFDIACEDVPRLMEQARKWLVELGSGDA